MYGAHAVGALARAGRARRVLVAESARAGKAAQVAREAESLGIDVERVPTARIGRIAPGAAHQGIVAYRSAAPAAGDAPGWRETVRDAPGARTLLVLDRVEDPRNLGACVRTASAFGVACVLVPRRRSAPLGAAARKAAAGAAERTPVFAVGNLPHVVGEIKRMGFFAIAADARAGRPIYGMRFPPDVAWILGGEARGPRRLLVRLADETVRIPTDPGTESLNVSVAAGICLSESARARPAEGAGRPPAAGEQS